MTRNMSVMRPGNNLETWTHQLHINIAKINFRGTFSHKIQMGDMCLWQNYARRYVLLLQSVQKLPLASYGVHMDRPMKLPLWIHSFATHWHYMGRIMFVPWNCPCKTIILPHIGITWGSHGSAHETAPVNPLFCHNLALHGAYIVRSMKLPM